MSSGAWSLPSRARRARAIFLLATLTAVAEAAPDPEPAETARGPEPVWQPGNRTTSKMKGEMATPDEGGRVSDGVYGRFNGDVDFGFGAGAELEGATPRGAARLSVHYFSSVGVYGTYRDAFDSDESVRRVISLGVDMRPAFIPRWARNMQQGPGFLDLTLDSISLGMAAFWEEPRGQSLGRERGFESSLGFGLPLFLAANGLWLESRAQLAWRGSDAARSQFFVLLSWHSLLLSPLASRAD